MFNINERLQKVNVMTEVELITNAVNALNEKTGIQAQYIEQAQYHLDKIDGLLKLPQLEDKLQIECKTNIQNPSALNRLTQMMLDDAENRLLVTKYITPKLAKTLKKLGLQYLDTVGNAYIRQYPIYIDIQGNKPEKGDKLEVLAKQVGKAFQPKGMKVVFMLLTNPDLLNATMRTIAEQAEVALGTVKQVIDDLIYQGFIVQKGKHKEFVEQKTLTEKWLDAYPANVEAKLNHEVFTTDNPTMLFDLNLGDLKCAWGGEVAALRYDHYLNAKDFLIHIPIEQKRNLLKTTRLRKAKLGEILEHKVVLVEPLLAIDKMIGQHPELIHPLMVCAQLFTTNDPRNIDAARKLYEQHLA